MGSAGGSPAHFGVPPKCPFSAFFVLQSLKIAHFREDSPISVNLHLCPSVFICGFNCFLKAESSLDANLMIQPRSGVNPIVLGGALGDAQHFGGFGVGHADEITEFD